MKQTTRKIKYSNTQVLGDESSIGNHTTLLVRGHVYRMRTGVDDNVAIPIRDFIRSSIKWSINY